jgi:hypothetical protein
LTDSTSSESSGQATLDQVLGAVSVHFPSSRPHVCTSLLFRYHGGVMVRYYIAGAVCLRRSRRHDIRFASVIAEEIRGHSRTDVRGVTAT